MMKQRLETILKNKKVLEIIKEMIKFEKENGFKNLEQIIIKSNGTRAGIIRLYGIPNNQFEMDSEIEIVDSVGDSEFYHLENIVDGEGQELYDNVLQSFKGYEVIMTKTFAEMLDLLEYREKAIAKFQEYMSDWEDEVIEDDEVEALHSIAWRERYFDDEYSEEEYSEDEDLQKMGTYDELNAESIEMSSSILIKEYAPYWVEKVNSIINQMIKVSWQDMYETFSCLDNRNMDTHELIEDSWLTAYEFIEKIQFEFESEYDCNVYSYNKAKFGITGA